MATFSPTADDLPSSGSARASSVAASELDTRAKKRTRRGFGWVRKLPSGRYQASYLDPHGTRITAKAIEGGKVVPLTFLDKKTAEAWLSLRQSELIENRWRPAVARQPEEVGFAEYAERWLASRDLSPKTHAEYRRILDGKRLAYASAEGGSVLASSPAVPSGRSPRRGSAPKVRFSAASALALSKSP